MYEHKAIYNFISDFNRHNQNVCTEYSNVWT